MPPANTILFPYVVPVKVGLFFAAYAVKSTVNILFVNVNGDAAEFAFNPIDALSVDILLVNVAESAFNSIAVLRVL